MHQFIYALVFSMALMGCEKKGTDTPAPLTNQATQTGAQTAAQVKTPDPHAAMDDTLVMVVERTMILDREVAPLEAYLAKAIGKKVVVQVVPADEQVIEALRKGEAQLSYTGAWTFMVAHQRADMEVQAVSTVAEAAETDSLWVVLAKAPIKSLANLKGKKIAFTFPSSAEGFLFPLASLMEANVLSPDDDPEKVFSVVAFAGSDTAALEGLRARKYDAVAISGDAWPSEAQDLRILSKQGPVPRAAFAAKSTMDPDLKSKVSAALLGLGAPENDELRTKFFGKVGLISQAHYEYTQALQKAIDVVDAEYPL
jgi:phosphonate transport system substrate-binding protein